MCSVGATDDVTFERKSKSTCSSVTSFSRSCLSKTPSRGKSGNGSTKRSVRFYPVSIIVDEDSRPCGHKCIYDEDPGLMPMPQRFVRSKSKREEVGRGADYLRSYHQKTNNKVNQCDFRDFQNYVAADDDTDSDDDDVESCSSSDLFELDHLIGIGRYREELPVYETTNLKTNQAIANGFIL
ncbi:hypothetical protein Tsubulata_050140 [Turnera subulata]|uniref:Uncharacterized protein n=1 Tax=Turnera subulata TaxID=218843 RepID=A0A9Q0GD06_9ROSI|nr:hypothetical protein Tsubulata_050140 [Turnera subulata]